MKYIRTHIPDIILCEPNLLKDERGYFVESFKSDSLNHFVGREIRFLQDNESMSFRGILRGLHYQIGSFTQTKLVRVLEGCVLDVALDIRRQAPTFGKHVSLELSSENRKQLLIPRGFAHGFVVLSARAILSYKVDASYNVENERALAYNDPNLNIDWKLNEKEIILSEKDKKNPFLRDQSDLFDYKIDYYA